MPKRTRSRYQEKLQDPVVRKRLERALKKQEKKIQPLIDAIRRAEQITGEDLRIVINV
jgi:hypothetical protein